MNNSQIIYSYNDIKELLERFSAKIVGRPDKIAISDIRSIEDAKPSSLIFILDPTKISEDFIRSISASTIICHQDAKLEPSWLKDKCFIQCKDPKLLFLKIGNKLFPRKKVSGIHHTAIISANAEIHPSVYIGPYAVIEECSIGENSYIHGRCHIYERTQIGKNVEIHSGCVIGDCGTGHIRNEIDNWENFPHIGCVLIGNNVEIFPDTIINCGSLGDTIIEDSSIIDAQVVIGHNVKIGNKSIVFAKSIIGGSATIGNNVWISLGSMIIDHVTISDNAHIGPGCVIIKDVPNGAMAISKSTLILPISGK